MEKIKGIGKARKNMQGRLRDFRGWDTYREVGDLVARAIDSNFNAQGRPRWPARKGQYPWPILDKTGLMRDRAEQSAMQWGHRGDTHINNVMAPRYGIYHQYGTKKLPERKFVDFLPAEVLAMMQVFRDAFLRR